MNRRNLGVLALLSSLVLFAPTVGGQASRENPALNPAEVYAGMLASAQRGQLEQVTQSLTRLEPVTAAIREKLGVDATKSLRSAVADRETNRVFQGIYRYIVLDIKRAFHECMYGVHPVGTRKRLVRAAYANYSVLAPTLKELDFEQNRRIQKTFWKANSVAGGDRLQMEPAFADITKTMETLLGLKS